MNILFIGNYQVGPGGEIADEVHLADALVAEGHIVTRVNRDEWREYVQEMQPKNKYKVPEEGVFDIAIIGKWHHFYDERFIEFIKTKYGCPVFYWVWDWMADPLAPEWHLDMARAADLYLSGELGAANYYKAQGVSFYYFQFDVMDGNIKPFAPRDWKYDVVFTGSHTNQNGRLDILKAINAEYPIKVFGYDFEEWRKDGFDAEPAVYGEAFNQVIAESKIILGTSAAANKFPFGYWSNRVGKVLYNGGFLLQLYTPGMELFLGDGCDYFSTPEEAIEKIKYYLEKPYERKKHIYKINPYVWTSAYKVRQLTILMERFLKKGDQKWMLP